MENSTRDQILCPWQGHESLNPFSCEEQVCDWARQPLNTYSNIGLLLVGLFLFWRGIKAARKSDRDFGLIAILIGVASTLGHASMLRILILFDYASQFILFGYLLSFNLHRYRPFAKTWRWALALGFIVVGSIPLFFYRHVGMYIFFVMAMGFLVMEYLNYRKSTGAKYKKLMMALGAFGVALVCFVLDRTKIVCEPDNHFFQMHSVWHLFVALSILWLADYYVQYSALIE